MRAGWTCGLADSSSASNQFTWVYHFEQIHQLRCTWELEAPLTSPTSRFLHRAPAPEAREDAPFAQRSQLATYALLVVIASCFAFYTHSSEASAVRIRRARASSSLLCVKGAPRTVHGVIVVCRYSSVSLGVPELSDTAHMRLWSDARAGPSGIHGLMSR